MAAILTFSPSLTDRLTNRGASIYGGSGVRVNVVGGLQRRAAPRALPTLVMRKRIAGERQKGVALHRWEPLGPHFGIDHAYLL